MLWALWSATPYALPFTRRMPQLRQRMSRCWRSGLGGKSFVLLTGEVAAVEASIRAAEALEETQGLMARSCVIPSPHPDMLKAIG